MENKNSVLLVVVTVCALVFGAIGVSFAFYTASTTNSGSGQSGSITTATVGDVTLTMAATTTTNSLQYPGGYLVVGASVTGKHTGSTAYNTTYTVNGTIANKTKTQLNWTLYEVSSTVATPVSGCTVKETAAAGTTQYTYNGCTVSTTITGGTKVKNGTAAAATTAGTAVNTTVTATGETLTTTTAGKVTYYYLVVEYPETNANQDADQGQGITASLTSISNGTASTQ